MCIYLYIFICIYIYIYNILCIYLRLDKCQATTHGIFKQRIHSKKKGGLRRKELTNGAIVLIKTAKIFKQHAATSVCSCGFHLSSTAYVQGSREEKELHEAIQRQQTQQPVSSSTTHHLQLCASSATTRPQQTVSCRRQLPTKRTQYGERRKRE